MLRLVWDGVYDLVRGADVDSLPRGGEHRPRGALGEHTAWYLAPLLITLICCMLCTAARGPADGFEITLGGEDLDPMAAKEREEEW